MLGNAMKCNAMLLKVTPAAHPARAPPAVASHPQRRAPPSIKPAHTRTLRSGGAAGSVMAMS